MKTKILIRSFTLGSSLILASSLTQAASIAINNYSFDADENTDLLGSYNQGTRSIYNLPDGELTGWIHQTDADTGVPAGAGIAVGWRSWNAGQQHLDSTYSDGREAQSLSLQSGASVLNVTGTAWSSFNVGDELTLTIALGMRNVSALNWTENTFFGLTDGSADFTTIELTDTVANSGLIANNPATDTQLGNGDMTDVSFTHTITLADLSRTGNVGILLYSQGTGGTNAENQAFFDNVRLNVVPEPSTTALIALSGLALIRRRR